MELDNPMLSPYPEAHRSSCPICDCCCSPWARMAQSVLWGCSPNVQHAATSQSPELEGFPRAGCNLSPQSPHWDMSAEPEHLKESSMYPTPKPCSSHLLLLFLLFLLPQMIS